MTPVESLVDRAAKMGHQALGLMDHGNMSGVIQLYKSCQAAGLVAFPGEEFYVVHQNEKDAKRYHLGMLALDYEGYTGMVKLSSLAHQRDHYHFKPRVTIDELVDFSYAYGEHVAVFTGCYFGVLVQQLMETDERRAKGLLQLLAGAFPHLYVEMQNHGIVHPVHPRFGKVTDTFLNSALWDMANDVGVPIIVTQDSHYCDQKQKPFHDAMKNMVIHSKDADDDAAFPGDSFHLATARWVKKHYPDDLWDEALGSSRDLLALNKLRIPAVDNYKFQVPVVKKNAFRWLERLAIQELTNIYGSNVPRKYTKRVDEELAVVKDIGMADYLLLVQKVVDWCHTQGIVVDARGSANSSLLCYLLGIINLDPVEWGLDFSRFLTRDRRKPPDVDLDIDAEYRGAVIDQVASWFGGVQIGTYSKLGLKDDEQGSGSAFVQYLSKKRKTMSPEDFKRTYGGVKGVNDLPRKDREELIGMVEAGVRKAPGAHAAGFLVESSAQPIGELVPTMLIPSSGLTVTQYEQDYVEGLGYMKLDLLGQRTLTTIRRFEEMMGHDPCRLADWIPNNDGQALRMVREGVPDNGLFQFEGWSTAKGLKSMKARTTRDCIHAVALFRPATMSSGATDLYLERRAGRAKVSYPHEIMERHLKETHGITLFQDQVIEILRDLGMTSDEINEFLSAIKASSGSRMKEAILTFKRYQQIFLDRCKAVGMSNQEAHESWHMIEGFAGYGFNKAHATDYGIRGYRMAYMKAHHTLEFMAALLETTAGTPKEPAYIREARRLNIRLLGPDVNVSGPLWTLDRQRNALRRGLASVKGVGVKAATAIAEAAPFTDFEDLLNRTDARQVNGRGNYHKDGTLGGVLGHLKEANALASVGIDRY